MTARRIRRVVTTRAGGRSKPPFATFNLSAGVGDDAAAVRANRERLRRELGVPVTFLRQVHGTAVATITTPSALDAPDVDQTDEWDVRRLGSDERPTRRGADAAVTAHPGLAIAVLAADCVPVLLADPAAGVVGAAHAGRSGAAAGVVPATVAAMTALGAEVARIEVLLGPAVCGGCYEVPAPMQAEVDAALPGSAVRTRTGSAGLDLRAGLYHQLVELGVAKVGADPRCTREDRDLYSHRRDGRTGRLAAITWLDRGRGG